MPELKATQGSWAKGVPDTIVYVGLYTELLYISTCNVGRQLGR